MKLPLHLIRLTAGFYNVKDALANTIATDLIRSDAEDLIEAVNKYPRIYEILEEIKHAYPEDIFPETTEGEREDIKERYPGFIDRTSASMGRHLAALIRRKLDEP